MVKVANRKFLGRQAGIEGDQVSKEFLKQLDSMRLATRPIWTVSRPNVPMILQVLLPFILARIEKPVASKN